jgi:hypothetical protein
MYYKYRKNPLQCHHCGLKFHTRLEKENHDAKVKFDSKFSNMPKMGLFSDLEAILASFSQKFIEIPKLQKWPHLAIWSPF